MFEKRNGFTIVELLIVVAVIAVLATIANVMYSSISRRAIDSSIASDLAQADRTLAVHRVKNGTLPTTIGCPSGSDQLCLELSGANTVSHYSRSSTDPTKYVLSISNGDSTFSVDGKSGPVNVSLVSSGLVSRYDANDTSSYQPGSTTIVDLAGSNNANLGNVAYSVDDGRTDLLFNGYDSQLALPSMPMQSVFMMIYIDTVQDAGDYILDARPGNPTGYIYTGGPGNWTGFRANAQSIDSSFNAVPRGQWIGFYAHTEDRYTTQMRIMSRSSASGRLAGKIGAVHIYDRQLSQSEVEQNFNRYKYLYGL